MLNNSASVHFQYTLPLDFTVWAGEIQFQTALKMEIQFQTALFRVCDHKGHI